MPDPRPDHWEGVYGAKSADGVSWFEREPATSLEMIAATGLGPDAALIDVGGGASTLVDRLLAEGYRHVTVLDVSGRALAIAKARLGPIADAVDWLVADITAWTPPPNAFEVWHDRAVFHFMVTEADRKAYVRALTRSLRSGGYAIIATFALTGPERCSGLAVQRYCPETLQAALGSGFTLIDAEPQTHTTPTGTSQDFVWCLFRKTAE